MACFIVPATEAVVTTIVQKVVESKEKKGETIEIDTIEGKVLAEKIPFSKRLGWLNKLLWGGSALLMFEHVWHGEVVPFFPFLSAAANPADAVEMLHEMATTGSLMAVLVTVVWAAMVGVSYAMQKKIAAKKTV